MITASVRISMYGLAQYHDEFVGVIGSFEKSLKALELLNKYKVGLGKATSVITKYNINDLEKLNSLLKEMGIVHKLTALIYPTAKGDLSPTELRISKEDTVKLIKKGIIDIHGSKCNAGMSRLRITPNGDVNPCELFRNVSFGNVLDKPIYEIIDSVDRKIWIENIKNELENSECSGCSKLNYCTKCMGLSHLENGNLLLKTRSLCNLADAKIESMNI